MIFQDPMTSLNPCFTVGQQIIETIRVHEGGSHKALTARALELLNKVGIPDAKHQLSAYPHQLSGGMSQRVMIAIAIACRPKLLIADEPTTALDVTIQAQILDLLRELRRAEGMGLILITHDIGVVSEMADRIAVMYAGQIVESGPTQDVIFAPRHPYTEGLLKCLPGMHGPKEHKTKLPSIPGLVPDLVHRPTACQLNPRCQYATELCKTVEPENSWQGQHFFKCHTPIAMPEGAKS
jgi:dipeptide transport system ATP-binding protein